MERLWSPAVATGGNRWQIEQPRKRLKQAKPVAVGCDESPGHENGKEGVDGSSPSEGSAKAPQSATFFSPVHLHDPQRAVYGALYEAFRLRSLSFPLFPAVGNGHSASTRFTSSMDRSSLSGKAQGMSREECLR